MAASVVVSDIFDAVRRVTNTETSDQANSFVPNAELYVYLNAELAELMDVIVENHDDEFFRSNQTIVTSAGTSLYALSADFYKITSVDVVWTATVICSAKRFTEAQRNRFKYLNRTWSYLTDIYYRTVGSNLEIQPVPQAGVTLQVNYIPTFTVLSDLASTFESHNQWHWMAIWGMAASVFMKDENDAGAKMAFARKEQVRERIISHASTRNNGEAPSVSHVRLMGDEFDG